MQLNVLDHLAEAMKALEEKSTVDPPKGNRLGQKKGAPGRGSPGFDSAFLLQIVYQESVFVVIRFFLVAWLSSYQSC